ncbi:hypothetical protein PMm318_A16740 [Pseudomonas moorei]
MAAVRPGRSTPVMFIRTISRKAHPRKWKKTAFYPLSVTIGHRERFAGLDPVAILRVNFTDKRAELK